MTELSKKKDWLDSKTACKDLHVSACELSHIREAGKLRYGKEGNAFRYMKSDVQKLKKRQDK